MAIKANVVTVTASSTIDKSQRVSLVGASSLALRMPVYDDIEITQNTRFVVVVPAGLGITGTSVATSDGTLFDTNGLTTLSLTSEGMYEFCMNNGRWYVLTYLYSTGSGGTPASPTNSVQFNNAGAFGGSANLIWDSVNNQLELANGGSQTQPALMFGSAMGLYQVSATSLGLSISSLLRYSFDATDFRGTITGAPRVLNSPGSAASAAICPNDDLNTGLYWPSADNIDRKSVV